MTMLVKYAVRIPHEGRWLYRSRHSSWAARPWFQAQLWDSEARATSEATRLRKTPHKVTAWDYETGKPFPVPTDKAEVVEVMIGQPV